MTLTATELQKAEESRKRMRESDSELPPPRKLRLDEATVTNSSELSHDNSTGPSETLQLSLTDFNKIHTRRSPQHIRIQPLRRYRMLPNSR